jgi:hypothetical protein
MRRTTLFFVIFALMLWSDGCSGLSDAKLSGPSGGGTTNNSTVGVTVSPLSISVVVTQTVTFLASVTGSSNAAVSWTVNGIAGGNPTIGTINANGTYTAPAQVPNPGTEAARRSGRGHYL